MLFPSSKCGDRLPAVSSSPESRMYGCCLWESWSDRNYCSITRSWKLLNITVSEQHFSLERTLSYFLFTSSFPVFLNHMLFIFVLPKSDISVLVNSLIVPKCVPYIVKYSVPCGTYKKENKFLFIGEQWYSIRKKVLAFAAR